MRTAVIAAAIGILGFAVAPAHAAPGAIDGALARIVADDDLAGGIAVIRDGTNLVRYTAGFSDVDTRTGFAPNTHIRAASITKTFVAAAVLQLVAEGKVDLDAPVETYLPGRIHGEGIDAGAITVRQLLRHQSGLPEYFDADTPIPTEPVGADELLDAALTRAAQFPPGAAVKYTNTNYVIAGLLIQAVTGRPAADEVTRRIILPLGLFDTYFPVPGDDGLRAPFAHGYEVADGRRTDVTDFNASAAGMSGALISTNEDTSAFLTALIDGRVIPRAQLDEMMTTVPWSDAGPGFGYGLGLTRIDLECGVTVWAHGGDIDGYHSLITKAFGKPALSMTLTQSPPETDSIAEDPRAALVSAIYCPA